MQDQLVINVQDLCGRQVGDNDIVSTTDVPDELRSIDVDEICGMEENGYLTYTTYDEEEFDSLVSHARWSKASVILSWPVLYYVFVICKRLDRPLLFWICVSCLILSCISYLCIFFYNDYFVCVISFNATIVLSFTRTLLSFLFTFATADVFLLFGTDIILIATYVAALCNTLVVHRLIPLFDDDDLRDVKRSERCCGVMKQCQSE